MQHATTFACYRDTAIYGDLVCSPFPQILRDAWLVQLYVAHLDPRASEEDVRTLFSAHGAVLHVRIIQDRDTGQSKGYGFVTMGAPNMAQVRPRKHNLAPFCNEECQKALLVCDRVGTRMQTHIKREIKWVGVCIVRRLPFCRTLPMD